MIPASPSLDLNCLNGNFLCGVVEGFYGRPWTTEQRKILFMRMKRMGLNTYLYAPKDDFKHRVYWRDLYSVEEADHLTGLINAATEQNVTFVYAISPGLDITYSSAKDVTLLKKKLEQVSSFGCKSFALLFDDIEVEMCESDKEIFQSFAAAQVSVTNEIYQHLDQCQFLFCPTEYCATRAVPNVKDSAYLHIVGSKLLKGIEILWTGPKVVSKKISIKSIEEIAQVLQRPPVIWDNIHANDYDRKRMFLGPYDGRSPELIPHLHGVLTNPNCEFEANYIAMHTLAQWCRSNSEGKRGTLPSDSPLRAEIKLETETDCTDDELQNLFSSYKPHRAMGAALDDWYDEMLVQNAVSKKLHLPCSPEITHIALNKTVPSMPLDMKNINELNNIEVDDTYVQNVISLGPVNSLVDSSGESDVESVEEKIEPMDCAITPGSTPVLSEGIPNLTDLTAAENSNKCPLDGTPDIMQVDVETASTSTTLPTTASEKLSLGGTESDKDEKDEISTNGITRGDLDLLTDFFYLPFEHGSKAVEMLTDVQWLKSNCHSVYEAKNPGASAEVIRAANEWHLNAAKMRTKIANYSGMLERLCRIPNKAILYDLFSYIWDMNTVLSVTKTFLEWLAYGRVSYMNMGYLHGNPFTWANIQYREAFSSGDQEPWVFQGGMQAEFQHVLPLETSIDLMMPIVPLTPSSKTYNIRPYHPSDQAAVYQLCTRLANLGDDPCPNHPDLIPDKAMGALLNFNSEFCFVIEDDILGVIGYVLSVLNAKDLATKTEMAWIPAMKDKYPMLDNLSTQSQKVQDLISSFQHYEVFLPEKLASQYPSMVLVGMLPECKEDLGVVHRTLAVTMAALKCGGSHGIHVEVPLSDTSAMETYTKLGFFDVNPSLDSLPEDIMILGRRI